MTQQESYQVIARKYRPQTFADVVGQEAVVTTLKNALQSKKLAHAYLFCGSRGTGKTTLARILSKALNCGNLDSSVEPCNTCQSCKEITSGQSLSVIEIDGASNRGIDDIRQINETIGFAPSSGTYKIYIIDEVHMLTREAFNALLKTLEEPPPRVKFFFATTEPHKILPTIISRCQRFDLRRISQEAITQKLALIAEDLSITIEPDALSLIAQSAEGGLRDAESLFDQVACSFASPIPTDAVASLLGILPRALFFEIDRAIANRDLAFATTLSERIFNEGKDFNYLLETLLEHYRTLLYFKLPNPTPPKWLSQSDYQSYEEGAKLYTESQCLKLIDLLMESLEHMSRLPFKRIHLEMIFLNLIRSAHLVTIDSLTHQLKALQSNLSQSPPPKFEAAPQRQPTPKLPPKAIRQELPPPVASLPPPPEQQTFPPEPKEALKTMHQEPLPPPEQQTLPPEPKEALKTMRQEPLPPPKPIPQEAPAPAPKKLEPPRQETLPAPTQESAPKNAKSHYDTVVRFAAVELEGTVKH